MRIKIFQNLTNDRKARTLFVSYLSSTEYGPRKLYVMETVESNDRVKTIRGNICLCIEIIFK